MSQPEPCPIPIGWTVSVRRYLPTDEIEGGIEIRATHESGCELLDYVKRGRVLNPSPGPKRNPNAAGITPEQLESAICSFLWRRIVEAISAWESRDAAQA